MFFYHRGTEFTELNFFFVYSVVKFLMRLTWHKKYGAC